MMVFLTLRFATFDRSFSLETGFICGCFQEFTYFILAKGRLHTTLEDLLGGRRVVQQGRMEHLACSFHQAGGF